MLVDAPYTIGVRAVPLGIAYQYRLPSLAERVHPLVSTGLMWAHVVDTWQSDTPAESQSASVYGLEASAGLAAQLIGGTFIVARGGYRAIRSTGDRYFRSIGLSGPFADIGLQWKW
ncbi:MAG TPA: hypothetical protein VFG50_12190 [Rhodothermales bacterium]|nr:hypothetical protein [Rhodothermales bacterium]